LKDKNGWGKYSEYAILTNESGFSALPGGYRAGMEFKSIGFNGFWWTSTKSKSSKDKSWIRSLGKGGPRNFILRTEKNKTNGYSVRCIKD
tara:strand:- start:13 stop:282 length:270 start_codon:yes stop_codon:yes gene_type:complete